MHHAGLITDRPPSVDGVRGLVHVATRAYPLAGAEDLTGASEVERVYLAGMAMQRNAAARLEPHQLRPAGRGKPQRAERLARPGRDPWHAAGVQRPGWFESHLVHGFLPWSAVRQRYGGMACDLGPIRPYLAGPIAGHPPSGRPPAASVLIDVDLVAVEVALWITPGEAGVRARRYLRLRGG